MLCARANVSSLVCSEFLDLALIFLVFRRPLALWAKSAFCIEFAKKMAKIQVGKKVGSNDKLLDMCEMMPLFHFFKALKSCFETGAFTSGALFFFFVLRRHRRAAKIKTITNTKLHLDQSLINQKLVCSK